MKPIILILFMSSFALADNSRNLEAEAKAITADPSFDKSKVTGNWTTESGTKATLVLELSGSFRIVKEREQVSGIWIGGKDQQIILQFKGAEATDHFTSLKMMDGKLVDDQVCYKVFYVRKMNTEALEPMHMPGSRG